MPAIRNQPPYKRPQIINHYHFFITNQLELLRKDGSTTPATCVGFICNAGASFYKDAKLAKAEAMDISNGNGEPGDEWKPVPEGEYIWCIVPAAGKRNLDCLILVDDFGWPILTGKNRYDYMPPLEDLEPTYKIPEGYMKPHGAKSA